SYWRPGGIVVFPDIVYAVFFSWKRNGGVAFIVEFFRSDFLNFGNRKDFGVIKIFFRSNTGAAPSAENRSAQYLAAGFLVPFKTPEQAGEGHDHQKYACIETQSVMQVMIDAFPVSRGLDLKSGFHIL